MWDKDGPAMILAEKPDFWREGDLRLPLSFSLSVYSIPVLSTGQWAQQRRRVQGRHGRCKTTRRVSR